MIHFIYSIHHSHNEQIKMYLFFVSSEDSETYPRVRDGAAKSRSCTQRETVPLQRTSACPARGRVGKRNNSHNFAQGNTNSVSFSPSKALIVGED